MTVRFGRVYYEVAGDDSGWVATMGNSTWTKDQLRKALASETDDEQRAEIEKAILALPDDHVKPKRGQRQKMVPADGHIDD